MELVYLWVEKYKNIHRQGFNFSPRFRCEYDPDINELVIDENDDYVDIFPDNINVTAIVGKNGSGKSSVLQVLDNIFINLLNKQYILIYREKDKNIVVSNIENLSKDELSFPFDKYKILILDNNHNYRLSDNLISLDKLKIFTKILYLDRNTNFELTTFMYIPNKIEANIKNIDKIFNDIKKNFPIDKVKRSSFKNNRISLHNITEQYDKFLICLFYHYAEAITFNDTDTIVDATRKSLMVNNIKYPTKDDFNRLFKNIEERYINELNEEEKIFITEYINFFEIDLIDNQGKKYNQLSTGERNIFGEFINIFHYIKSGNSKIFLLDEPDNTLHPNWQKQYINELSIMLNKLNSSYDKLHFILTTHSPFLLSDIPKQNIIFLDTDEEGKCKVVDGLNDKKETFGANIHTLLSDSFFMEDGLMGEFAKDKINNVIKFLKNEKSDIKDKDEAKKIIEIIGEPFLKQKLEQMYKNKYPKSKEEKIQELEAELERLKND